MHVPTKILSDCKFVHFLYFSKFLYTVNFFPTVLDHLPSLWLKLTRVEFANLIMEG